MLNCICGRFYIVTDPNIKLTLYSDTIYSLSAFYNLAKVVQHLEKKAEILILFSRKCQKAIAFCRFLWYNVKCYYVSQYIRRALHESEL